MGLDIEFRRVPAQAVDIVKLPIVEVDREVFVVEPILELRGDYELLNNVNLWFQDLGYNFDFSDGKQVIVSKDLFNHIKSKHQRIAWDNIDQFFIDGDSRFVLIFWAWW